MPANNSDVARLTQQIEAEYQAAQNALHGPALGTARHAFITARMERTQKVSEQLIEVIGKEAALPLIVAAMDGSKPS